MSTDARAQTSNPVADMFQKQVDLVEQDLVSLAEAMPADKYEFRPASGAFEGVRTFGEQIKHAATMIYMTAAIVLEEKSPFGPGTNDNGPDSIQGKAPIVEYLRNAIAYARSQLDPLRTYFGSQPRVAVAAGIAFHSYDHYGQLVVYARMNGVTPPASRH
jgi:hypothetical protein